MKKQLFKIEITVEGDSGVCQTEKGSRNQLSKKFLNPNLSAWLYTMTEPGKEIITGMTLKIGSVQYSITKI